MCTCLERAPFTGQTITNGAVPVFAFTEHQSDIHVSSPHPALLHVSQRLLTLRPSRVGTDSPHLLWLSRAHPCWFLHRLGAPQPVCFRIAHPPLKRPQLFPALPAPLWGRLPKSCAS